MNSSSNSLSRWLFVAITIVSLTVLFFPGAVAEAGVSGSPVQFGRPFDRDASQESATPTEHPDVVRVDQALGSVDNAALVSVKAEHADAVPSSRSASSLLKDVSTTEYWAVIVGVSDYQSVNDLNFADDDAQSLFDALKPIWGEDHLKLLVNSQATKANIESAISGWLDPFEDADDVVLFFFSGHGYQDGANETICPYDVLVSSMTTHIYDSELSGWLANLESAGQVVVLDSCFSGGFITGITGFKGIAVSKGMQSTAGSNGSFVRHLAKSGRVILTGCAESEYGYEYPTFYHGVFSQYLLEGLKVPELVDSDGNDAIAAEELFAYAQPRTVSYVSRVIGDTQHPQIYDGYSEGLTLFVTAPVTLSTDPTVGSLTIDGRSYPTGELPLPKQFALGTSHTISASATSGTHEVATLESPHPYTNNYNNTWTVSQAGATRMRVHFEYIDTERCCDRVYVKDGNGITRATYAGSYRRMWSEWVSDNTVKITLYSDYSILGDGFVVDEVEWESRDTRHSFQSWSDNVTSASRTVTVNGPLVFTANYARQYLLTINSERGSPEGAGWYNSGSTAQFSVTPFIDQGAGTGYAFDGWSGDSNEAMNSSSVVMTSPNTVTANWSLQYRLSLQSQWGDPSGGGWYDVGATALFSVSSPDDHGDGTRHVFANWSGGSNATSSSASIVMNSPQSVTADWDIQYYLTVQSQWGDPSGEGWYDSGATAPFSVTSLVDHGDGTRHVFTDWSGDHGGVASNSSISMTSPKTVAANWRLQCRFTVNINPSGLATISGDGWYDKGTTVATGTAATIIDGGAGTRYRFSNWTIDGKPVAGNRASLALNSPQTALATYTTEYYLSVQSDMGDPQGSGWYDSGSTATISVRSPLGAVVRQVFTHWNGDSSETTATASITMDRAKSVTANWRNDYMQLYALIAGVVVVVGLVVASLILLRRKGYSPRGLPDHLSDRLG